MTDWKRAHADLLAAVEAVHGRYFDTSVKPSHADAGPEPEDVWRYDRALRAVLADHTGTHDDGGEGREVLPLHHTEAGWPRCSTCDGGGCPDCTDPA